MIRPLRLYLFYFEIKSSSFPNSANTFMESRKICVGKCKGFIQCLRKPFSQALIQLKFEKCGQLDVAVSILNSENKTFLCPGFCRKFVLSHVGQPSLFF